MNKTAMVHLRTSHVPNVVYASRSIYHINMDRLSTSLIMQSFVRLGQHDGKIVRLRNGNTGVKCVSQGQYDTLPSSGNEPRADNLAIANLQSQPLSCTATSWDDSVKCLSQKRNGTLCPG